MKSVDELSGRELDVAVAEEVMGLDVVPGGVQYIPTERQGANIYPQPLPCYSDHIEAAWEVVWHVTAYGPDNGPTRNRPPDFSLWKAGGSDVHEARFGEHHADAACSAPIAICRAALKAVRESK